ncbi:MAG: VacJ family lipoprotein [Pseudomonadota bacterium]
MNFLANMHATSIRSLKKITTLLVVLLGLWSSNPAKSVGLVAEDLTEVQDSEFVQDVDDPFEDINRVIFAINMGLDTVFFRPLSELYGEAVPDPVRKGVHNVVRNLNTPVTLANDILQFNPDRAGVTIFRFLINTTIGLGGLFDVASEMGFEHHYEDFGQTLASAGIDGGPYLMLPILGPSNTRDLVGRVADFFMDPINWIVANNDVEWVGWTRAGVDLLDVRTNSRELTDRVEKTLDPYAQYRSLYTQSRKYRIRNEIVETGDLPQVYEENGQELEE